MKAYDSDLSAVLVLLYIGVGILGSLTRTGAYRAIQYRRDPPAGAVRTFALVSGACSWGATIWSMPWFVAMMAVDFPGWS